MKILLVGSGGREHAIAWKLAKNKNVEKIYVAPGNGGTLRENKCENIDLNKIEDLISFSKNKKIDLTIVGPEEPLINGIVDSFKKEGLKIFGPDKKAARLEGSKAFSKDFMKKYGVKTAEYKNFYEYEEAKKYLENSKYPLVIKADGIAAGKGVVIAYDKETALETIKNFMVDDIFNGSGKNVVIEEFLSGVECSILSICDGKTIIPFLSAKDHKQIFDNNEGPNTGGMGVVSPNPYLNEEIFNDFKENIMDKTLEGIKKEGFDFKGIIFFGIMMKKNEAKLLEYNVRFGDPETQSLLYLMDTDLLDLINLSLEGNLEDYSIKWSDDYCVNVVLSSKGYPFKFEKGEEVEFSENLNSKVFISGAKEKENKLITNGGRVLSVVGKGKTLEEARKNAYNNVEKIKFKGMYYRKDIGF